MWPIPVTSFTPHAVSVASPGVTLKHRARNSFLGTVGCDPPFNNKKTLLLVCLQPPPPHKYHQSHSLLFLFQLPPQPTKEADHWLTPNNSELFLIILGHNVVLVLTIQVGTPRGSADCSSSVTTSLCTWSELSSSWTIGFGKFKPLLPSARAWSQHHWLTQFQRATILLRKSVQTMGPHFYLLP